MIFEGEILRFAGASESATAEGEGRPIKILEKFTSSLSFEQTIYLESYLQNVKTVSGTVRKNMLSTGRAAGG